MMISLHFLLLVIPSVYACPLKTVDSQSGCFCGIEIDGTNYIRCQPYSIDTVPEFTRSYVYDTLNLSKNFIRHITNQSWNQLKVKKIILQQNLIESIERNAFEQNLLNYLEELRLDMMQNGSLEFLCHGHWTKLRFLQLNGFRFDQYQSCFGQLSRLETLIVENSQLDQLSYHIYLLPNLQDLTLRYNQLEYLHFDIDPLTSRSSIRRLNLTHNQLRTIPNDLFSRFPQLNLLDLSHNFIENLPILPKIGQLYLNLSHNLLQYLQQIDDQHQYDLSFNPICTIERSSSDIRLSLYSSTQLHCDCRLAFFLNHHQATLNETIGIRANPFGDQSQCLTPKKYTGLFLKDLTYRQLFSHCMADLPDHCREITQYEQLESYLREINPIPTAISSTITTTIVTTTSTTQSIERIFVRLSLFSAVYENNDLIITWNFDQQIPDDHYRFLQFQVIVEEESRLNTEVIRRSGRISPELRKYIVSHIPPNKNYYVCLLLTQFSYGTDKYCREIRATASTTSSNLILSKQTFTHLLFTSRSILFGFLIGTILTACLLLALAFLCYLRLKRQRCQRAASSLLHYQHHPIHHHPQQHQQQQQQQTQYLYAGRNHDDDDLYSNSLLSSPKYCHSRKIDRRTYFSPNQPWYRRPARQTPTSAPTITRCCYHHHNHTPDITASSSSTATARRMTTLSSQYSQGLDKEPMTSTSIMSSTSLDEQQSQINENSPAKHVYEELTDEGTMLRRHQMADFFL